MNYTTINIENEKIGLKFGMYAARYLSNKLTNGFCFDGDSITEIGISHVLYAGYLNNCAIKDIEPTLTFERVVDFVEECSKDADKVATLTDVIKVWTDVQFAPTENTEGTKKKKISKKSKS